MTRVLTVALAVSSVTIASAQSDLLKTLQTTAADAQEAIFTTLLSGNPDLPFVRTGLKAASDDQRVLLVRAAFSLARTFVGSAAFLERYAAQRESRRPVRSQTARSGDEALTQQQQAMETAIKAALENAGNLPADQRKQMEESIVQMRKQIAELNADPEYRAAIDQMTVAAAKQEDEDHARRLAAFNAEYPDDVNGLVARRLRQFLLACGDVDFAATLEAGADKRMRFVNPAYERRSAEWKMCFRAGRPAVEAARAAATEWLKAIAR